ncbi:MAG TPA: VOC family protein [Candidatus Sulfotelmatobacter sp.]|jgi:PhnB protein|nr:VOC family protein [Candidatus Sulfotelmatobacter sp.]
MARVTTYLNFPRNTEEAFTFYKTVFGTEFVDGIHRMSEVPEGEGQPPLSEEDKNLVMNVQLPIIGGHLLLGTDAPESMGFKLIKGDNVHICLDLDTRAEADKYFNTLSEGGKVGMQPQDMFWGAYFGSCTDKFGIHWMFNCTNNV